MNYLEVGVYVFVIFLAVLIIWIGREFIRARRARRESPPESEAHSVDEVAEQIEAGEVAPEQADEVAKASAASEAATEAAKQHRPAPAEAEAAAVPAQTEQKGAAVEKTAESTDTEALVPADKEGPAPAIKEEPAPAIKEAAKPVKKEAAKPVKKEAAKPVKKEAAKPVKKEAVKPVKKEAAPEPARAAVSMPVPKPAPPQKEAFAEPEIEKKRLKKGLRKTRKGFISRLGNLFRGKKELPADIMDQLEEVLFTADIGVRTSERLFKSVKEGLGRKELDDAQAVWQHIKNESAAILDVDTDALRFDQAKPFVILTVGVNGVGKTTTIGKLAQKYQNEGHKVILAAGDTFRAAAVEQLEVWGERVGCPVSKGQPKADPSSVVFEAIKRAEKEDIDIVIADTAGRLHTKRGLMEELEKIHRVAGKAKEGAPHETWLVLDATTGQNAIQQAHLFREAVDFSGVILTKMDGTAKGGIILGVCDELKLPVRYVGIGERVEDLRPFDPHQFVEALYTDIDEST